MASPGNDLFLKQQLGDFLYIFAVFSQQLRRPGMRVTCPQMLVGSARLRVATYVIIFRTSRSSISAVFSLNGLVQLSRAPSRPP